MHHRRGFLIITTLLLLGALSTLAMTGLWRSSAELVAAQQSAALQQADYAAEAGLQAALHGPLSATFTSGTITTLLETPQLLNTAFGFGQHYTVTITDNPSSVDASILDILATGQSGTQTRTLRATVQLPVAQSSPFDYTITAGNIYLGGNATLGESPFNGVGRVKIAAMGHDGNNQAIDTTGSATVWASEVDSYNYPGTLAEACPNCSNPGTFPISPPPAPVITLAGVGETGPIMPGIRLMDYYNRALQECQADGMALAQCEAGNSYHHIVEDTVLSESDYPGGLEGIIYVEAGVEVEIKDDLVIWGTLVHEGTGTYSHNTELAYRPGRLTMPNQMSLKIDSEAPTRYGNAFAPGMAIIGAPLIWWRNGSAIADTETAPGINGFIMAESNSTIESSGTITGGIIGVEDHPLYSTTGMQFFMDVNGPDTSDPIVYDLTGRVLLKGGGTTLKFKPLPMTPPGVNASSNGLTKPAVLFRSATLSGS